MTKIICAPSAVLSQISKPYVFQKDDKFLPAFLREMEEALLSATDPKGVGLAAPQIGKAVAIFMAKPTEKSKISVFINPKILDVESPNNPNPPNRPKKRVKKLEGCLSLPNIWGEVKRSPAVIISYYDRVGRKKSKTF